MRGSKKTLTSQALEIVTLWEDVVCLRASDKSLIPSDWLRAKKHLAQLARHQRARTNDLPFSLYRVCVMIARHNGSITMGALSHALNIPLSTATRLVQHLEHGGYVERTPDPEDRRIVRLALTPKGHALHRAIQTFAQQRVEAMLHRLTPKERTVFLALLHKALPALTDTA
ncbi:MAG: MarR family transcriptional regulator [Anaerolineae bacterium]|nr:MarR family transcriptional regulator [Anaerolineae bacterium]